MLKKLSLSIGVLASLLFFVGASPSEAGVLNFEAEWSGVPYGNTAHATAFLSFDPTLLNNPGYNLQVSLTALSITVTGASSGNGTFGLSDFGLVYGYIGPASLDTNGGTLDFSQQLIGQPTSVDPWGTTTATSGDFNLFSLPGTSAPLGVREFTLAANRDISSGDLMVLTSFKPAEAHAVPEPSSSARPRCPWTGDRCLPTTTDGRCLNQRWDHEFLNQATGNRRLVSFRARKR